MPKHNNPFDALVKENNVNAAVELLYSIYTELDKARSKGKELTEEQVQKEKDAEAFLDSITKADKLDPEKEVDPGNQEFEMAAASNPFLKSFINAFGEKYAQTVLAMGKKRDKWADDITEGKVPEAIMAKNDTETVNKIAHDIVLAKERDSRVLPKMKSVILSKLSGKRIGEKSGEYYLKKSLRKASKKAGAEAQLNEEKINTYFSDFENTDYYAETGFKLNTKPYKAGQELFEQVPQAASELHFMESVADVDEFDDNQLEIIEKHEAYFFQMKSCIKKAQELFKGLEDFEDNNHNSPLFREKAYNDLHKYLKKFSELDPDSFNPVKLSKLLSKLNTSSQSVEDISETKAAGTAIVGLSEKISILGKVTSDINALAIKEKLNIDDYRKAKQNLVYIAGARAQKNYLDYNTVSNDNNSYARSLNEQMTRLTDSLVNDGVYNEKYHKLINTLLKDERLYKRNWGCYKNKLANDEFSRALKANKKIIAELINDCLDFEKNNKTDSITGSDRTRMLNNMLLNINNVITNDINVKFSNSWAEQKGRDELWFGMNFALKSVLKDCGHTFDENDRVKYGFNMRGTMTEGEAETGGRILDNIIEHQFKDNRSVEGIIKVLIDVGRNEAKAAVVMGKDYEDIYNALEGEPNRELKAKYLFNLGGRFDINGMNEIKDRTETYIFRYVSTDEFKEKLGLYNHDLTLEELLAKVGLNEKEIESTVAENNKKHGTNNKKEDKIKDSFLADPNDPEITMKNITMLLYYSLVNTYRARGIVQESKVLSETELKYFKACDKNIEREEQSQDKHVYAPIKDWIDKTGYKMAQDLYKVRAVEKMQRAQAVLSNIKQTGVKPDNEIGRFYNNYLKMENTYFKELIKDGKSSREVCDKIIEEQKSQKLVKKNPLKVPVNYDTYVELHTASRMGETPDDKINNLAKTMAACTMKEIRKKFDVKQIHRVADMFKNLYDLDSLKENPDELRETLRGPGRIKDCINKARSRCFGVKETDMDSYTNDMKTLLQNMWDPKGRSTEYNNLYKAVKAASEIGGKNWSAEKKAEEVIDANINLLDAIQKYTDGKEKTRHSNDGNARFANAMDALAVAAKYTGMKVHANKIINKINTIRHSAHQDNALIDADSFTQNYGADRAKNAKEATIEAANAKKTVKKK